MAFDLDEYHQLRGFLQYYVDRQPSVIQLTPENHPVAVSDRLFQVSRSKAMIGLKMAINDILEDTSRLPQNQVRVLDTELVSKDLPSLTSLRARFWGRIKNAVKRGHIRSETEYYAIRNAAEIVEEGEYKDLLWSMLDKFEAPKDKNSN